MTYDKPEVVLRGSAIATVQAGRKTLQLFPDSVEPTNPAKTNGAYEADE